MGVLAIDLGTKTGWAFKTGAAVLSGGLDLSGSRYEGGGMRFLRFRSWLDEMAAKVKINVVFYEEVRAHKGTDAAHVYGGLQAVLTSWCEERKIAYEGVPVQAIKKHITGKGNAGKPQVMACVREFGFKPNDDNEADAIALLLLKLEDQFVQTLV